MRKVWYLVIFVASLCTSSAWAQCVGAGGLPFNCQLGTTPGATDIFSGGNTTGAQANNSVKWTGLQVATGIYGLAPSVSGGGTANFLRADGTWAVPPGTGGGGGTPGGTNGQVQYNANGTFGGLTNTQLTADINTFTTSLSGAVPASGGGTTSFLRADGTWVIPSGVSLSAANTWTALQTFSSGASASALTLTGITGSTQCLTVNTSGVVSGTGSACGGLPTNNPTFTGTLAGPTFNATGTGGYSVLGNQVLNTYANQVSPIISPEGSNPPNANAIYAPNPFVNGWAVALTAGSAGSYNAQETANVTVTGTDTNHWGLEEHTINLTGTGTFNAELNVQKNYLLTSSSVTLANGENFEAGMDNFAVITAGWSGFTSGMANQSTGTINRAYTFAAALTNQNTTGGSIFIYAGLHCAAVNGTGSAPSNDFCIMNEDPNGSISNWAHYSARPDNNVPTTNANCGTSPAFSARSSDDAGQLTMGTGTPTTCSILFHLNYGQTPATVIVFASDGLTQPTYTYNSGGINFTSVRAGGVYQYWVMGSN